MEPSNALPFPEVDIKVEDVAIRFDDDGVQNEYVGDFNSGVYCQNQEPGPYNMPPPPENPNNNFNYHFLSPPQEAYPKELPKRFPCTQCHKSFSRSHHLKSHMRTHTGERPFACDLCQRSFAKHSDLTRHKQFVHGSVTTFYICEECGRTFSRKDHLKSHLLTHKNRPLKSSGDNDDDSFIKTYSCDNCGRAYIRLENLKKHQEQRCESVEKSGNISKTIVDDLKDERITEKVFKGINFHFMSVNDVKNRVDNTLRSYPCEFCSRLFIRKDHLKNHERTHTGERPFQCERCDKRFAKRFVMTRHLRNVHRVNTKMHKCPDCDRMFARTDHLKTHMRIHILAAVRNKTKSKVHICGICEKEFTRSDNLKTHMKIHLLAAVKLQQQDTNNTHQVMNVNPNESEEYKMSQ